MPNKAAFSDRSWQERETILGDPAEHRFRVWAAEQYVPYTDYGLRRPQVPVYKLPAFIRYTPDFLLGDALVEVQGCGRDQIVKLKHDKLAALSDWDKQFPVYVWLWNQTLDQIGVTNMDTVFDLTLESARTGDLRVDGLFDGDKPYASIRWDELIGHREVLKTPDDWLIFRPDWQQWKAGRQ
jgi:hypothetical protein